ncbi:MAG: HDIG domain-containing protein [Candidatus Gastranaerophilales bacterium]|nr:HDIG domain-containing protein [Candidatus Gastranaerophilales bacterium]
MIFISILFILTLLLSSKYYFYDNLIEFGVSKTDVIAKKTIQVIDKEKTERRKHELANKVEPTLRPAQDSVDEYVKMNLKEIIYNIKNIRKSSEQEFNKKTKIKNLFGISENSNQSEAVINYLYKSSNNNFSIIETESVNTLEKILNKGISEVGLANNGIQIIFQNIEEKLSKIQHESIILILKKILLPNMVIDEYATDIARNNVMNSVRPIVVTYKPGEKIVSVGDYVSRNQKQALKLAGYNISNINLTGLLGILSLVGICLLTLAYYLRNFEQKYMKPSYLSLMSLLSVSIVLFAIFLPAGSTLYLPVYIIPIPAVAILMTIFTNSRVALLYSLLLVIMISVSMQYQIEAIAVFTIGSIIATFSASKINYYRRMDMAKIGFNVGIIQMVVIISIYLLLSSTQDVSFKVEIIDIIFGLISGIISGIIVLGTLPMIENTFKIITPYGLAELADHNQTLLKRLQFEAPGTYHHSLMVSNLAEAATEAVGGNPVLARVGAFYHDIGKLKRPLFFVENQSYFGIENPHEKLNPRLSKMVITAHPKDGLELAKEYKLPNIINQFIIQHHGDGLASYFYKQAIEMEGYENISEEQFRYTCPKPNTKEVAVLMLADAVESATRALKNPAPGEVEETIDKIIQERLIDGQLTESPLTQKDLKIIAVTFNRILRGMQHHRIKYHENMLEELGQKTSLNIQMANSIKKIEKDFSKEVKKND